MLQYEDVGFHKHKIWKIKADDLVDNQKIKRELEIDRETWFPEQRYNDPSVNAPGIQIDASTLMGSETRALFSKCYDRVCEFLEDTEGKVKNGYMRYWFYISVPEQPNTDWHDHVLFHPDYKGTFTDYTWVYYVNVPNNCEGSEGMIFFRDTYEKHIIHKFFPEPGYIYLFDAGLEHLPALAKNSTEDRITAAGNIIINFE